MCSISPVPVVVLRVEAVRGRGCISSSSFVSDEQLNPFCVENVDRIPPEYDIDLLCLEFFRLNAMLESLVLYFLGLAKRSDRVYCNDNNEMQLSYYLVQLSASDGRVQ